MSGTPLGSNTLPKIINRKVILFGLVSIVGAATLAEPLTRWITHGKTFTGRSLPVQGLILFGLVAVIFSVLWAFQAVLLTWLKTNRRGERICEWISTRLDQISTQAWIKQVSLGIVLAGLFLLLILNTRIAFFPYQMEFREGAIVLTNQAFLNGINPWALENNLEYINVYGIVYNAIILPFTWLIGNQIWIYRLVSMLAILGQILLLGKVALHNGISWLYTGILAVFIWIGQLYYTTPMARPDTLGQLFFLITLFVPYLSGYSRKSLVWSGVFAILGFYTKPYFVLGLPLMAAYVFLFHSKVKAVWYSVGTGAALGMIALVINRLFEAYFLNVVFSHIADTNRIFSYMVEQSIRFGRDYWSVLLFGLIALVCAIRTGLQDRFHLPSVKLGVNKPLISVKFNFNLFCLVISAVLIFFSLGQHNGTKMAYYYQLLSPFLLLLVLGYLQRTPRLAGLATLLISANLVTHGLENLKPDLQAYPTEEWKKVQQLLAGRTRVANSPAITYEVMRAGLPVINSGQTSYYYPYPETNQFFYPDKDRIRQVGDNFLEKYQRDLELKEFDLLLVDTPYPAFAKRSVYQAAYTQGEVITINMPHTMQTWRIQVMTPQPDN